MHPSQIHIHLHQPAAPAFGPPEFGGGIFTATVPTAPAVGTVASQGVTLLRRPIRDRVRAGLVAAVLARTRHEAHEATEEQVNEAIDEVTRGRPLIDWLANGGLEKLIEIVLAVLKLAA